jgi:hypothetical protein
VSEQDSFRLDGVGRCFSAHGVVQHMGVFRVGEKLL